MSRCNHNLTIDLAIVTLSLKILTKLYLQNRSLYEADTLAEHWLASVGVQHHGMTSI